MARPWQATRWATRRRLLALGILLSAGLLTHTLLGRDERGEPSSLSEAPLFYLDAPGLFRLHCAGCHSNGRTIVDVDPSGNLAAVTRDPVTWQRILAALQSEQMPPPENPQPSAAERAALVAWIEEGLAMPGAGPDQPARLAFRRLSREEYRNTIRVLFGLDYEPTKDFPKDQVGWAYGDDLPRLEEPLAQQYAAAAEAVVQAAPPLKNALGRDEVVQLVAATARRAWRRPVTPPELRRLLQPLDDAAYRRDGIEPGMRAALRAVLTAPEFVFRTEYRPSAADEQPRRPYELASRLSFLIWSAAPDDALLAAADETTLEDDLPRQTLRLLRDPRAAALAARLATFWLGLPDMDSPGPLVEPALHAAMLRETEAFLTHVMREDRPILELIAADYSFLNERLGRHYGIDGIAGEELRQVSLAGSVRGGILTHGSVLAATAPTGNTIPSKRGRWVLENMLGQTMPLPPPGLLQAFRNAPRSFGPASPKELVEKHRADPACARCHERIDPFGETLEYFDSTGAWRSAADGFAVHGSGTLQTGETLHGPAGLKQHLLSRPELFVRCVSGKLWALALGRPLRAQDWDLLETSLDALPAGEVRFADVLVYLVQSRAFARGCFDAE
jgi:hypothetical protein